MIVYGSTPFLLAYLRIQSSYFSGNTSSEVRRNRILLHRGQRRESAAKRLEHGNRVAGGVIEVGQQSIGELMISTAAILVDLLLRVAKVG